VTETTLDREKTGPARAMAALAPRGRIPALDGLRGIAILLVLLWHAGFNGSFPGIWSSVFALGRLTWSGVDLFFVLSGFLIGGILLDARDSTRYFRTFYLRRAFRILPLYGVITGLYVFRRLLSPSASVIIPLISYPTFTQNFWMAYFATWGGTVMTVTWSLAVEEQFYLTIPLLVRKLTKAGLVWVLAFVVVGAPILRTLILLNFEHGRFADYVLMPCRADALCLGVFAALLVRHPEAWGFVLAKRNWLRGIAAGLLVSLGWLALEKYGWSATPMVTFGYSLLALFYTCCLLMALIETGTVNRILCNRWLMGLGGIAYCVYLVHVPFFQAGDTLAAHLPVFSRLPIPYIVRALACRSLAVILILAVAKLSWRFLERPLLLRGHAYKY
jgi:peptidoglycan/LPS O-acetylase OafA/YrhL